MEASEGAVLASASEQRRTVRTFDGAPLAPDARELLESLASHAENPYGIPVGLRLVDAEKYGATSRVIRGTSWYVVGSLPRCAHAEEAFGYVVERLVLSATAHGLGTAWLAGTIDRPAFERVAGVDENRIMPAVIAVGVPAARMSVLERVMRSKLHADERAPWNALLFEGDFAHPVDSPDASDPALAAALACVRLAPSARNLQPWRLVCSDGRIDLFEHRTLPLRPIGDVQLVDMGIAMLHLEAGLAQQGMRGSWSFDGPRASGLGAKAEGPEGQRVSYVATISF